MIGVVSRRKPGVTHEKFVKSTSPLNQAGQMFGHAAGGTGNLSDWQQHKATLRRFFTPALGFDDIVRINGLDGVRVYFHNGDVAHVRPSGNALQLRIYANSDSQARADQIVELGLREADGILRQLERAFTQGTITASR